jgi:hypothetical protein
MRLASDEEQAPPSPLDPKPPSGVVKPEPPSALPVLLPEPFDAFEPLDPLEPFEPLEALEPLDPFEPPLLAVDPDPGE